MSVIQSHGGSGKQALEVANGLEADVVTLALEGDVQVVADAGLIEDGFADEFEQESSPYTSTIVFWCGKAIQSPLRTGTICSGRMWASSPRIRRHPAVHVGIIWRHGTILRVRDRVRKRLPRI